MLIRNCAVDMLNQLPTHNNAIVLIARNNDYDCILCLRCLQHVKPIVNSNRFLQIKATYYNPIQNNKITLTIKDTYKLISMPLRGFGGCFKLDVSKDLMPYNTYIYIYC